MVLTSSLSSSSLPIPLLWGTCGLILIYDRGKKFRDMIRIEMVGNQADCSRHIDSERR